MLDSNVQKRVPSRDGDRSNKAGAYFEIAKRMGISYATYERSKKIIEKGTEEQNNLLTISKMDVLSFSFFPHLFMLTQYCYRSYNSFG